MDRNRLIPAKEIRGLVADGKVIVIYEDYALKLDSWIDKHPGGRLAVLHMVGRDATDEINVYHFAKTIATMKAYRIGRVQQPWTNLVPPIRAATANTNVEWKNQEPLPAPQEQIASLPPSSNTSESGQGETDDSDDASIFSKVISSSNSSVGVSDEEAEPLLKCPESNAQGEGLEASVLRRRNIIQQQQEEQDVEVLLAATDDSETVPTTTSLFNKNLSRAAFTAALEQKEVADGIRSYPSLDPETQQSIRREYAALHKIVQDQGLYNCPYAEYGKEMIRYSALFAAFLSLLRAEWYLTSAIFLGLFWQQIMFTAHDAGHRGITGNFVVDTIIGAFIGDFCCGLSIGWWKSSHNVHHLVTNMPEHDPDIQNIPLFSNTPTYFKSITSTYYKDFVFYWDRAADIIIPYQKYLYYPIMALARFNLYMLSILHLVSPRAAQLGSASWTRWLELVFMTCYWFLFGYCLVWRAMPDWPTRVGFVLISHGVTMLLHVQITLSHWGMPTSDLGPTESFAQRQLRTTMDVECPEWLDWFHGGLQFQAVHHMFPRLPRHNLRKAQVLVREFCAKTGIRYNCEGFVEGNNVVLSRLEEVSAMVDLLVKCQLHMAETGESGLH